MSACTFKDTFETFSFTADLLFSRVFSKHSTLFEGIFTFSVTNSDQSTHPAYSGDTSRFVRKRDWDFTLPFSCLKGFYPTLLFFSYFEPLPLPLSLIFWSSFCPLCPFILSLTLLRTICPLPPHPITHTHHQGEAVCLC